MKEVAPSPNDEIREEHDMLDPQEPPHMNIFHKINQSRARGIIQEAERYGAPEGSIRQSKNPKPFPSYADFMCDLVDEEPNSFDAIVQNKEWVESMTEEYQCIMKNDVRK